MMTLESFLEKVKQFLPGADMARISHAYEFARQAHEGQKRYSGESYITHPLATASLLIDFCPDEDSIVAALLHDVSEDTGRTLDDIEVRFGKTVRDLVTGMEKLSHVRSFGDESQIENLQKMFLSMAKDFRVILIKLCDRFHNIQTLRHVPVNKQYRIARETLEVYAPIASRLGIYRLKTSLEDYAFRFVDSRAYADIEDQLKSSDKFREDYIRQTQEILQDLLAQEGLQATVDGRLKGIYSIYRKMKRKNKTSVDEIFDVFAMRITLPDITKYGKEFIGHLYTTLGVIHSQFTPLAHRFKDYVAVPKVNGYRSLHTTVMGLGPKTYTQPTEIQIRTHSMHEEAEFGVASHWLYEATDGASTRIAKNALSERHLEWLKGLSQLKDEVKDQEEFLQNLQIDIFSDRIFVFTPRGDVKDLPKGATPLDFAFAVHSEIGYRCYQAKVNGNIVSLNYELKNGEVVEILTRKNVSPHQNWLSFVKTRQAMSRIQAWFRNQNHEKHIKAGKELFNQYLAKFGKPFLSPDLGLFKEVDGKKLNFQEREDILAEVGKGTLFPGTLVRKIFTLPELLTGMSFLRKSIRKKSEKKLKTPTDGKIVLVAGHPDMPTKFANCCRPSEIDAIGGFVTRGSGVTIHRENCRVFQKTDRKRWQQVKWVEKLGDKGYRVKISLEVDDRVGVLRDIGEAVASLSFNIEDIVQTHESQEHARIDLLLNIRSYEELDKLLQALEMVPNVSRAYLAA